MVNYDKESFVAGITVGRQLKGWATERVNSSGEMVAEISVNADTVIVLAELLALSVASFEDSTLTAVAYISTSTIDVDLGTVSTPVTSFGTESIGVSIEKETTPTREISLAIATHELQGSITASATLEVIQ